MLDVLVNQSYQLYQVVFFANGLYFIFFFSNLSISSIDTLISLKNCSSFSFPIFISLAFNSLSFNSFKFFSNSKKLFFIFRIRSYSILYFCLFIYCLNILSPYVRFCSFVVSSDSSFYILRK